MCPYKSPAYKPTIKVVNEGPIETTEGQEPTTIEVISSLPPDFMCANRIIEDGPDACQVQVEVIIDPKDDKSCVAGETYPQAVVGYPDVNDESMTYLTNNNPLTTFRVTSFIQ